MAALPLRKERPPLTARAPGDASATMPGGTRGRELASRCAASGRGHAEPALPATTGLHHGRSRTHPRQPPVHSVSRHHRCGRRSEGFRLACVTGQLLRHGRDNAWMSWAVRAVQLPDGDRPAELWVDAAGCLVTEPVPGAERLPGRYVAPGLVDAHAHAAVQWEAGMPVALDGSETLSVLAAWAWCAIPGRRADRCCN